MSLGLVKKNSSSPFRLQRSMVDQGGEGGAYESGGYDPDNVYRDNGVTDAIAGFGKIIGSTLASRTSADKNASNEKKAARLERRGIKTESKKQEALKSGNVDKADRLKARGERVEGRLKSTKAEIEEYNKSKNPVVTSDIGINNKKEVKKEASKLEPKKEEAKTESSGSTTDLSSNDWRTSLLGWGKRNNY